MRPAIRATWQVRGWVVLPTRLPPNQRLALHQALTLALGTTHPPHGWRGALTVPAVRSFAEGPWLTIARMLLRAPCRPLQATLFDKNDEANWWVPWHRDRVVPQVCRHDRPGWSAWSIKNGINYAEPPEPWLSQRVALRIHLDQCPMDAGPLRVRSGSHRHGGGAECQLPMPGGAILAMHPMLEHASSPAQRPERRVLHVEYGLAGMAGRG